MAAPPDLGVAVPDLGVAVPDLVPGTCPLSDLTPYTGTYRSNQLRVHVSVVDGQPEGTVTYEPADHTQERIFTAFAGGSTAAPPRRYVPIRKDLFAPAGLPHEAFTGYCACSSPPTTASATAPRTTGTPAAA